MRVPLRRSPGRRPLVVVADPAEVLGTADHRLLGADERARGRTRHHPAERDAYLAARLLVRGCAAVLTGRGADELSVTQWCAECRTSGHGAPSLVGAPEVRISWAHTRGAVVAAAAWDRVGVDVEALGPDDAVSALAAVLTPAERSQVWSAAEPSVRALRYWTRKECLVKAGLVAASQLARTDLSRVVDRTDRSGRSVGRYRGLQLVDWRDPARGALIAVAGSGPPVIRSSAQLAAGAPGWTAGP